MGYWLWESYGLSVRNPSILTWEIEKCMCYQGVWVKWGMGYIRVDCSTLGPSRAELESFGDVHSKLGSALCGDYHNAVGPNQLPMPLVLSPLSSSLHTSPRRPTPRRCHCHHHHHRLRHRHRRSLHLRCCCRRPVLGPSLCLFIVQIC